MKQIIIALLIVILLILGFNTYQSYYNRFHSPGSDYVSRQKIDLNYYDKTTLQNYYQAIEDANSLCKNRMDQR